MDYYEIFSVISLPLGILILLLLVCRPLVLWYFRIPDMIEKQDDLIRELRIQNKYMKQQLEEAEPAIVEGNKETAETIDTASQEKKMSFTELRYGKS